ncbi:MAG: hypothetical protein KDK25_08180 [Leptospiraceae bacterium]|nr:hypothetical protein [Leptospiraceae bacterium]
MISRARKWDIMRSMALLALIGFGSQYPIPEWHHCPQLQPDLGAVSRKSPASHQEHQRPAPSDHRKHQQAAPSEGHGNHSTPVSNSAANNPPCHGSSHQSSENSGEGSGHEHSSCPVCQGYLLLGVLHHSSPAPAILAIFVNADHQPFLHSPNHLSQTRIREILARPPPALS